MENFTNIPNTFHIIYYNDLHNKFFVLQMDCIESTLVLQINLLVFTAKFINLLNVYNTGLVLWNCPQLETYVYWFEFDSKSLLCHKFDVCNMLFIES